MNIKERIDSFKKLRGIELVSLLLHPFVMAAYAPVRIMRALWESRVLINKEPGTVYSKFHPSNAFTHLFYWVMSDNLQKYGRMGISPSVGDGKFTTRSWFHIQWPAAPLYRHADGLVTIICMFVWLASFLVWAPQVNTAWLATVMLIGGVSSSFYFQTFYFQNYNVIGWMFLPLSLWAMQMGHWWLLVLTTALMGWISITVYVSAAMMLGIYALAHGMIAPIFLLTPGGVLAIRGFFPLLRGGNLKATLAGLGQGIGLLRKNPKYSRPVKIDLMTEYFLIIGFAYCTVYGLVNHAWPYWSLSALFVMICNRYIARYADFQSVWLMLMSGAMTGAMTSEHSIWLVLALIVIMNPYRNLARGIIKGKHIYGVLPQFEPFRIDPVLKAVDEFTAPVQSGERLYMVFKDPKGLYSQLFDGYHNLIELFSVTATKRNFHFMPDWHLIMMGHRADHYMGDDPQTLATNLAHWNPQYLIVMQNAGTELDARWAGYDVLNILDWRTLEPLWVGRRGPYSAPTPCMWLLKAR